VNVLVTGHAGFIGSVVTRKLMAAGHNVTGVSLNGPDPVDARDFFHYDRSYFDLVIHCAAVVGGRLLVENGRQAHAANLEIDASLFQWAEVTQPGHVIYVSSVSAYPITMQHHPGHMLREDDINLAKPAMPDKLYGWAKLTGELLASQSSAPVSVVRPFTVYGPGQDKAHPVASFLSQVLNHDESLTVWGTGMQIRDFIFVDDVADGIIAVANEKPGLTVNLATGHGTTLAGMAYLVAKAAGQSPQIQLDSSRPEGLPRFVGSVKKLSAFFTPRVTVEEGTALLWKAAHAR
jgi:nucleoside-diphosphate-sugar epimerase